MARYVVPPIGRETVIVKCNRCKTLYVPDTGVHPFGSSDFFEVCPTCGYDINSWNNVIPLWKYNLIKWFRGGKILEQTGNRGADD